MHTISHQSEGPHDAHHTAEKDSSESSRLAALLLPPPRSLRTYYTEHLLLEERWLREGMMASRVDGVAISHRLDAEHAAITAELERRAALYRMANDPTWPDVKSRWYERRLEQARILKTIWPIDQFFEVLLGVALENSGSRRMLGRCPFHPDKNPSMTLYLDDDHFHCFGCGAHGDIFDGTGFYFRIDGFAAQLAYLTRTTDAMTSSARNVAEINEQTQQALEAIERMVSQ